MMERNRDIGSLLKAVTNAKDAEENRRLKEFGLTAMQMHVLLYVYDAPRRRRTMKDLERGMLVSQSTMAKLVRVLVEDKRLLVYGDDPDDRRVKWVRLSDAAVPVCRSAVRIVHDMEALLTEGMAEADVALLRSRLEAMYDRLCKEGRDGR